MSVEEASGRARRLTAREEDTVTPLELFFDLVFVLALTQCTRLMADEPTWEGVAKGLLILGVLWWSWVGYAWLTSVVDPEEDAVRLTMFVAMAALLVVGLCVPGAFGDDALVFALAYAVVRIAHIGLFLLASRDDPLFRTSVVGLAWSTAIGTGLLVGASFADGALQGGLWAAALLLDMGGPYFFGAEGWKLAPHHFAERHALIIIIALGESIVAIGVGAEERVDAGIVVAASIGTAIAAAQWWLYFDVVYHVAARRLADATAGRLRNEMARDSYSYMHFPMVAGIVLVALGMKKTLGHVEDPLKLVPAAALLGGTSIYLLAHVAFRYRHVHTLNVRRLGLAIALVACVPVAVEIPALATVAILAAALGALIAEETRSYGTARAEAPPRLKPGKRGRAMSDTGSWFPVPDEAALPGGLRGLFAKAREQLGFVPNVFRVWAYRPERLSAWFTHFRDLHVPSDNLDGADRELIAVVVSQANGCLYCLVAHGAALRAELGDPVLGERLAFDWRRAGLDARRTAICAYAEKLTLTPRLIGKADLDSLLVAGLTLEEAWDVAEIASMYNLTNRMAMATNMLPNEEYASLAR